MEETTSPTPTSIMISKFIVEIKKTLIHSSIFYKSQKKFLNENKCMQGWNPQKPPKQDVNSFQHILHLLYIPHGTQLFFGAHIHTNLFFVYPTAPPPTIPRPFLSTAPGIGYVYCSIKYFHSKKNCIKERNLEATQLSRGHPIECN